MIDYQIRSRSQLGRRGRAPSGTSRELPGSEGSHVAPSAGQSNAISTPLHELNLAKSDVFGAIVRSRVERYFFALVTLDFL